jgi:2'-hydroxyisoflavone reductase
VEATVKDTLAWYQGQEKQEKGRTRLAGPSAEQEAKLLAAWRASQAPRKG